ncbi:MAG: hypothetical protein WBB85_08540, partial [Albidovulum sp.]|uniref:hypothetical protein n=1 Tax=Albidovulum sp. TaxID=1872424 RepID=UPI003C9764A9
ALCRSGGYGLADDMNDAVVGVVDNDRHTVDIGIGIVALPITSAASCAQAPLVASNRKRQDGLRNCILTSIAF